MADRIALASTFRACRDKVTEQHVKMLAETFGPLKIWSLIDHGFFGVHRVRIEGSVFDLDDDGAPAFIFPVSAKFPDASTENLVDLWAVPVARPEMKARYRDNSDMLGEAWLAVMSVFDEDHTFLVHRTVGSWIASGCMGVVPFDLQGAIQRLIYLKKIQTDDEAFARELAVAMEREAVKHLPPVSVVAGGAS
jgi:hypothetical protein